MRSFGKFKRFWIDVDKCRHIYFKYNMNVACGFCYDVVERDESKCG